jgi:hypothetical protein
MLDTFLLTRWLINRTTKKDDIFEGVSDGGSSNTAFLHHHGIGYAL